MNFLHDMGLRGEISLGCAHGSPPCKRCQDRGNKVNCIEADNEIHLIPDRLFILEEKVLRLEERISLFRKILEKKVENLQDYMNAMEKDINNIYCERCHPKFDEDGIL